MKATDYLNGLPIRVRNARLKARMSQQTCADALGISRATLSRFESGKLSPQISELVKLSELTGVNFEHLVLGSEPLQQALDQIDHLRALYNEQAKAIDKMLNSELLGMRNAYIERYGEQGKIYPIKRR